MTDTRAPDARAPEYSVPALDKALDILELLADTAGGLSQAAIAEAVGRSVGQIFRVLQTLESRGYLHRDGASGLYFFSIMTFELAHRHDPVRGLRQAALGPMRRLSDDVQQSCNLGMLEAGRILILAQVESPASFGFRVRVGAEFPVESTATGAVLVACAAPGDRDAMLSTAADPAFAARVARVAEQGFERMADSLQPGITDIVFPLIGASGVALAALTVPYVATTFSGARAQFVEERARAAAAEISAALGA
ncbi:IclR family transcriptional regulator [Lacisediminihabitans sp.]|uniref:IclR family transcriptional regulator n=1 Tax=Lacisediminihabitans sp. TaxID=2787631 RepID=UPI00374CB0EA